MRALFVCARNRLRSPTAEALFGEVAGLECASAGTAADAECVLDAELVEWADAIFVMERRQARWVKQRFSAFLEDRRLVCLDIRDVYTLCRLSWSLYCGRGLSLGSRPYIKGSTEDDDAV